MEDLKKFFILIYMYYIYISYSIYVFIIFIDYFCAATETTVWERPPKPAIVLKHHWACFEADGPGKSALTFFEKI